MSIFQCNTEVIYEGDFANVNVEARRKEIRRMYVNDKW